jgi:hypothetical protein
MKAMPRRTICKSAKSLFGLLADLFTIHDRAICAVSAFSYSATKRGSGKTGQDRTGTRASKGALHGPPLILDNNHAIFLFNNLTMLGTGPTQHNKQ